jgi:hypothetical protein
MHHHDFYYRLAVEHAVKSFTPDQFNSPFQGYDFRIAHPLLVMRRGESHGSVDQHNGHHML